jgi:hypothetical protein
MRLIVPSSTVRWLTLLTVASVLTVGSFGGLSPWISPDTAGYFDLGGFSSSLAAPRTPVYGWLVSLLTLGTSSFAVVPSLHLSVFIGGVWLLAASLLRFGLSEIAVISLSGTLLFSNAVLLLTSWIHPELFAIACSLYAISFVFMLACEKAPQGPWPYLGVLIGAGLAYLMRPSFLPFAILLPVLYVVLRGLDGRAVSISKTSAIALASALPFICVSSVRAWVVSDFNIVSFGGFQMSGMAALMLDEDLVARLPAEMRAEATSILDDREQGEKSGEFIGIPLNSSGTRSFVSVALGYFDVLARTYDDVLHGIVRKTRKAEESWVEFNRRLMRFSTAVISRAPQKYLAWVVGATTRVVGRVIVTNGAMAVSIVGLLLVWPLLIWSKGAFEFSGSDFKVLVLLAIFWLLGTQGLTVLVTFHAGRYIDTSALFVAGPTMYLLVSMVVGLRSSRRDKLNFRRTAV